MAHRNPTLRRVGLILFSVSIILGTLLTLLRAFPDLEATMYGFIKYGYPRLTSLACPVFMTTQDREPVSIRLHNSLDRNLTWYVEAQFSSPVLIDTVDGTYELQPNEVKNLSWEVDRNNIDLGNFIFARVFSSAATANGMRESTCGTYVMNLPIQGGPIIFYGALALAVMGTALGFFLWWRNSEMIGQSRISQLWWMRFITIVVAIGLIAGLLDFWFVALVMVLLTILATAVNLIPRKV